MTMKSSLSILFVALASTIVDAQGPVRLDSDDVYFQYRPAQKGTAGAVGLCGFSIRGNHNSRANPRVEWDLNIDELIAGTTRVAGISAGTFEVVGVTTGKQDRQSSSFTIDGEPESIPARSTWLLTIADCGAATGRAAQGLREIPRKRLPNLH
jgi:hypothetical protein